MSEVAQNEPVEPTPQEGEVLDQVNDTELDTPEPLEGSTDETPNEDDAQAEAQKPAGRREKRISQLTFEKYELERQKNAEIEALKKQLEEKQNATPVATEGKPTKAQFDYDDEAYFEALADWKAEQKVKAFAESQNKQQQTIQEQQLIETWTQKRSGYASEHPEYTELATQRGAAVTSPALAAYITASDIGPKLHHELLENFGELQRIQALPEWQQGAELAKLETKLTQVKPKQKSNAPEPVKPVSSSQSTSTSRTGVSLPTNW